MKCDRNVKPTYLDYKNSDDQVTSAKIGIFYVILWLYTGTPDNCHPHMGCLSLGNFMVLVYEGNW